MHLVPIGDWIAQAIDWLLANVSGLFDAISVFVGRSVDIFLFLTTVLSPVPMIIFLAALAWWFSRKIGLTVFTVLSFLLIWDMGLWEATMTSLAFVIVAVVTALILGLPVGIWAGLNNAVSGAIRPVLDLMQALPVFVYLIPAIFFFGVGVVPGIAATIVFALPPVVRLTELGIRQVDADLIEAVHAFGAKKSLVLREVQLPLAVRSIMVGINQTIMLALSMVVIAGLVGSGGLGAVVVEGVTQLNVSLGFQGGIAVVILAIYLDRVTASAGMARPRGRRKGRRDRARWEKSDRATGGNNPESLPTADTAAPIGI